MSRTKTAPQPVQRSPEGQRGSALVLAIFVLVLLTSMGTALLFLSQSEVKMSQADVRTKVAFYLAEAGLEDARQTLWNRNRNEPFDDDLKWYGGMDEDIEFDFDALGVTYDTNGNVTGVATFDDDRLLVPLTAVGDGWYAAYLTNDPAELIDNTADGNKRVMITSVGAGPDRSLEIVQAIVERRDIFPAPTPAAITLIGPSPQFVSGDSKKKEYIGEDCGGSGVANLHVPVIGTIGSDAEDLVEDDADSNPTYDSGGGYTDDAAISDITDNTDSLVTSGMGTIDMDWQNCQFLLDFVDAVKLVADVVCVEGSACTLPAPSPDNIIFSDGDLTIGPTDDNEGVLLVTGRLTYNGQASWNGIIFVVGEGEFVRTGGGNKGISGATFAADIAGPDNDFGTDDDCTGGDGGFDSVLYEDDGGGNNDTTFCLEEIIIAAPAHPYQIVNFQQR